MHTRKNIISLHLITARKEWLPDGENDIYIETWKS